MKTPKFYSVCFLIDKAKTFMRSSRVSFFIEKMLLTKQFSEKTNCRNGYHSTFFVLLDCKIKCFLILRPTFYPFFLFRKFLLFV